MPDIRYALRNGDPTSNGGVLISIGSNFIHHGKVVGREGDIATCPACKSQGIVLNDCFPSFDIHGKQILVSGARVNCDCQIKPFVIHTQTDFTLEVSRSKAQVVPASDTHAAPEVSSKFDDAGGQDDITAENPDLICQNMSNAEFQATIMRLRDKAIRLVDDRLLELQRWATNDQVKVERWFGNRSGETRRTLIDGLGGIRKILHRLKNENFERYTEEGLKRHGCVPPVGADANAATASVCKPDGTFTVFIGPKFCRLPDERNSSNGEPVDGDSKLLVLIHEVSHFPSAMNSEDKWYVTAWSKMKARMRDQFCIVNADNIAAYVVNIGD